MQVLKVTITKIEVPSIDKNSKKLDITIYTDSTSPVSKTFAITRPDELTYQLIDYLKQQLKQITLPEDEDLPISHTSVHLMNEEEDYERIAQFLGKIISSVRDLNKSTSANDFMKMYQRVTDKKVLVLRK
ncbi:MAG: hypothetical protein HYS32_03320 [Candidatus Woesearchaeota archaeon]|nr:MAG: hypothetical protein HYS32_03320 [Candidatus Woesearchaeota archaeon]